MWNTYLSKLQSSISAFLCIVLLAGTMVLTPLDKHGEVLEAEALFGIGDVVFDPKNAVLNNISAIAANTLFIKEITLDGIASGLAKLILKSITQSILTWINSGFEGSPAFVTDLEQFLLDRADQVAGDFIYGSELDFLCSPFQLDVKIALATAYQEQEHEGFDSQCTLSGVTDNVEGFLSGSFNEGGWASWFEVTQNPINTPTGAYLAAEGEMYARITDEEGRTVRELDWGAGFLSFKVCSDTQVANGDQQNCDIVTPGKVIEQALTVNLQSGTQALIEADEINEIIGALFSQLAQQAITGVNGLLGLGGGSQYSNNSFGGSGGDSFLDALAEEDAIAGGVRNPFVDAINLEGESVALQNEIITIINASEGTLQNAIQTYGNCISVTMPPKLLSDRSAALTRVLTSSSTVGTLLLLNETYTNPADPQEQIAVIETYQQMSSAGLVTNEVTLSQTQFYIDYELRDDISTLDTQIRSAINRCDDDD